MSWLNKYPDGGKVSGKVGDPPTKKAKIDPLLDFRNDPLRPKGLGVQAQDNLKPIPLFNPKAYQDFKTPEAKAKREKTRATQAANNKKKADDEVARRKALIDKSNKEGGFKNSAVAEKMRLFPESAGGWGEVFDDYINLPRVLIGESADKLGHAKTAKEYAAAIATPIAIGAAGYNPIENIPNMIKNTGKFLTEQTPLKNTYKLNPYAEKLANPNNSYRVAGRDSYNDFLNTGTVRSVAPSASLEELSTMTMLEKFKAIGRPTSFPSFQKGFADTRYLPKEGGVVYETSVPTFKRGEINPVTGETIRGRHYAHRPIDMKTGKTITELPASDVKVFEGKPNWLQGYKEIPK